MLIIFKHIELLLATGYCVKLDQYFRQNKGRPISPVTLSGTTTVFWLTSQALSTKVAPACQMWLASCYELRMDV